VTDEAANGTTGWKPVGAPPPDRKRQLLVVLVAVVAVVLVGLFGVYVLPRWWANVVATRVRGSLTTGIVMGVLLGGVLTLASLAVAALGFKRHVGWRRRVLALLGALVLSAPNLTTLGVVFGRGGGARSGRLKLDASGDGFRGASLVGAVLGIAAFVGLRYLLASRRAQRREVARLRDQLHAKDAGPQASA
jgi:MFS family permease